MVRAALIVLLATAPGCGHRRAAAVGGLTVVGAIGMGVPLAQECSPDYRGECDHRYAVPMIVGAIVGLTIGLVVAAELPEEEPPPAVVYQRPAPRSATIARRESRTHDPEIWDDLTRPIAPSTSALPVGPIEVPLSYECVIERRDALDRECRFELTDSDANVCECAGGFCDEPIAERCHSIEAAVRVLGFAASDDRRIATASALAAEDATRRCFEAGGTAGATTDRCHCDDEGFGTACWCVAEVVCEPQSK